MDLQLILNSTLGVFIATRYGRKFISKDGRLLFSAYLIVTFLINWALMVDEFETWEAAFRAFIIALCYGVGSAVMGRYLNSQRRE